jgi:photosystem II stability/assembly factor-like uncharacterized protein
MPAYQLRSEESLMKPNARFIGALILGGILVAVGALTYTVDGYAADPKPELSGAGLWRGNGPFGEDQRLLPVADVAASPNYAADGTLFAATTEGIYRSTDRGGSWQRVLAGAAGHRVRFTHVRRSPAFAQDGVLFGAYVDDTDASAGLYKSVDGGESWTQHAAVGEVRAMGISPAYAADQTLFIARGDTVWKSTDGGDSWTSHELIPGDDTLDVYDLTISPLFASDGTLFASGFGRILRSADGGVTWTLSGGYGPAYEIVISPNYAVDGRIWSTFRAIEAPGDDTPESSVFRSLDHGASWQMISAGLPGTYEPFPRHLAISPAYATDRTLFTALSGQLVAGDHRSLYRTFNDGDTWIDLGPAPGNPDIFGLTVTSTATEGIVVHVATSGGVQHYSLGNCEERLANRGFEGTGAWRLHTTAYPAAYTTARAHSGVHSLRTGIAEGTDVESYSSAAQTVTIPADLVSATLSLWWYPLSAEGDLTGDLSAQNPDAVDRQYVLILDAEGELLQTLLWTRSNAADWQLFTADLSAYAGQTVRIHVGTYNNGNGQRTAMYIDDVSLITCRAATPGQIYLPNVLRSIPLPTPTPVPLQPRWLRSLVAAPGETGALTALTNEGRLVRSTDRGATWSYLPLPDPIAGAPIYRGYVGIDYLHPETQYLGVRQQGLWKSSDGGATWSQRSAINAGPLTVSLDNPDVLWTGIPWSNQYQSTLVRSADGGASWHSAGAGINGDPVSPILIDPQAHSIRYLIAQGDRGGATLYRTIGGDWTAIPNAPVGTPPSGGPGLGLALDGGSRGLYVASNAGTLSVSHNAHATHMADITWTTVSTFAGGYLPIPLAVGAGPQGGALYLSLFDWFSGEGRTLRSDNGGLTWTALTIPELGMPPGVACYEAIVNGGIEDNIDGDDGGWTIRDNPVPAGYVNSPVYSGGRSMRTGIPAGGDNVESYSPFEQSIAIPELPFPGMASAVQLRFWRYNVYGDGSTARSAALDPANLPQREADLISLAAAADFFYVIAIHTDGTIDWLMTESEDHPSWREKVIDLEQYAGQTIRLQFGTYNNGTGGVSRTYFDDVSLRICPPEGALLLPGGWVKRVIGRPELNTLYADVGGNLFRSDDAAHWAAMGMARPEAMILGNSADLIFAGNGYPCYAGGPDTFLWRGVDQGRPLLGMAWQVLPAGQNLKPLVSHPSQPWLYAAGCNGPYLSQNNGDSFAHQPGAIFGVYDARFIAPEGEAWNTVWVGGISEGGGGAVIVSRDGGMTWAQSTPLGADLGWLGDLAVDRYNAGRVFAPAYNGFFQTLDNGATWASNSVGLEDVIGGIRPSGLYAVVQRPDDPSHRLYLGTERGLYTRDPGTGNWSKVAGQPFDQLRITDLLILDSDASRLYVTTSYGVFVYRLPS